MNAWSDWPHGDRCPSRDCHGQFLWVKYYGVICTARLMQLTEGSISKVHELSRLAYIASLESVGGA